MLVGAGCTFGFLVGGSLVGSHIDCLALLAPGAIGRGRPWTRLNTHFGARR